MEPVAKKKRPVRKGGRLLLLLVVLAALAAIAAGMFLLDRTAPEKAPAASSADSVVTLYNRDPADVQSVTVQRQGEDPWTITRIAGEETFTLEGSEGFSLSPTRSDDLAQAASSLICEETLSADPAEYQAHLAEFGLDVPSRTATVTFTDGTACTLSVGSRTAHNTSWYYLTVSGDDRLFALSASIVNSLFVSRESLWDVEQPTIHKARIDRITLLDGSGAVQASWELQGDILDDDALERWQITAPFVYPADSSAISSLLANAANLRLGAYVAPATAENLTRYGFDEPRLTIEIHMAAGAIGNTDMNGVFTTADWPESSVTFVIGGERSDMVDYVRVGDAIYVSSHFSLEVFMNMDPRSGMNRYPVLVALGNLASLTIEEAGAEPVVYAITRTEQVAPNNDLVTDEEGNIVWDVTLTRNGEPADYDAFASAYSSLVATGVSGVLPEEDAFTGEPHTLYTFQDVDGSVHTVALTSYGVLHDAVSVDGHQAFYITKGDFRLQSE